MIKKKKIHNTNILFTQIFSPRALPAQDVKHCSATILWTTIVSSIIL